MLSVTYASTVMYTFSGGSDGATPNGPVVLSTQDHNLYGITNLGGLSSKGTIFQLTPGGDVLTSLFLGASPDAVNPVGGLTAAASGASFFGVAQAGGTAGHGSIFTITNTGEFTTLASFTGTGLENATVPEGPLVDVNGNLYGVLAPTATNGAGEVFELPSGSSTITDLGGFLSSSMPAGGLVADTSGNLYGMLGASSASLGSIFKVNGNTVTTIASFTNSNAAFDEGNLEQAPLVTIGGDLYGIDAAGMFTIAAGTSTITQLGNTNGLTSQPDSPLVADANGNIFGTTPTTVFEWSSASQSFTTIATLPESNNGFVDGVTLGSNGTLYVTDGGGGSSGNGAIYQLTPSGASLTPTITSTKLPSSVIGGAKISGSIKITLENSSNTATKGATLKVYASTDTMLDPSTDTVVATVTSGADIKAGKSATVTIPITSLPESLAGTYNLIVDATTSDGNSASVVNASPITVGAPAVTLSETVTSTLARSLISGGKVKGSVIVSITNSGNVASSGVTTVAVLALGNVGFLSMPGGASMSVGGEQIASVAEKLVINPGKTVKVTVPIKSLPMIADGSYSLQGKVTSPFDSAITIGTDATPVTIAAPFIRLGSILGAATTLKAGDTVTVTNLGNIEESSTFTEAFGFSTDSEGADPVGQTTTAKKTVRIMPGKSLNLHLTNWAKLSASLSVGTPYFLTLTLTDTAGNTLSLVSTTSFTM